MNEWNLVPLDMPFEPTRRESAIQSARDAKFLENAQRLKNLEMKPNEKEGWLYKENFNIFKKMLKEMRPGKLEITPDDPKDKEIADQMNALLNWRENEY